MIASRQWESANKPLRPAGNRAAQHATSGRASGIRVPAPQEDSLSHPGHPEAEPATAGAPGRRGAPIRLSEKPIPRRSVPSGLPVWLSDADESRPRCLHGDE